MTGLRETEPTEPSVEITFPVLNEERRLETGVRNTIAFLQRHHLSTWSIAIADNGSTDATISVARDLSRQHAQIRCISVGRRGVGLALKESWGTSQAEIVGYMDVDLATDLEHLHAVRHAFTTGTTDVVNGSRLLPESQVTNRTTLRTFTSRGFNLILQNMLRVRFSDGMCGFKFLRRQRYMELLSRGLEGDGWFFCTELLVKSEWSHFRIQEIPVHWTDDQDSRVRLMRTITAYMSEIFRLREQRSVYGRR